ncbi:hypothetical protein D3C85_15050 [compost metagenome]
MKTVIFFNKEGDSTVCLELTDSDHDSFVWGLEQADLLIRVESGNGLVPDGVLWTVDHEDYMDDVIVILLAAVEHPTIACSELAELPKTFRYLGIYHK